MQVAASSSQRSIHICTNKTCRRQGSPQVRQTIKWLLCNTSDAPILMGTTSMVIVTFRDQSGAA